ncbi:response regulator transcription factor [Flavobacterium sp. CYK-55]|uniref:LytR/AlgR family response regulator transcription factor n=1 Tax=Flavobacterium sp. CYK-55 TaxID=2835529 RepID=UPI001BD03E57|nr:LytTR family DNA-binding domain-containing protein [Flavobacterium sp. CYK-55]MBS7787168.1 response regulator transcription factor [Flavobacterium sp. CYK-55]
MSLYQCLIIDDDEIDRLTVMAHARKHDCLKINGVYSSADEALQNGIPTDADVLFLDIDMPGINGLEFRKIMSQVPVCIFITAHPEHAAESFNLETLDFIVKPLKQDRFAQTIARIEQYFDVRNKAALFEKSAGTDTVLIKEGHKETRIKIQEILYLEALKDYTLIITPNKKHCVLSSLGNLLKESYFQSFIRIHRSYAVQKSYVKHKKPLEIELENGMIIPIGRSYKDIVTDLL